MLPHQVWREDPRLTGQVIESAALEPKRRVDGPKGELKVGNQLDQGGAAFEAERVPHVWVWVERTAWLVVGAGAVSAVEMNVAEAGTHR